MDVDYIVVGLGLAGLAFAEQLIAADKNFVVFENNTQTSSLVAGGVYNPVILKRFTPVWNGQQQLEEALPFYKKLEAKFQQKFIQEFTTKRVFKSIEEQNNWFEASDKPLLTNYMKPTIDSKKYRGVIADFGFGELQGTGRIDTEKLISCYRNFLIETKKIRFDSFDYNLIEFKENKISYKNLSTQKVVFCEGFGIKQNPFFNHLPLKEAKGELITIYAPQLDINFLLKSNVFVLPLGRNYYKVGATFNWTDKTPVTTDAGKNELVEKLKKVLSIPYTIVSQSAGIRPTVKDRRPLVGVHKIHDNLAVLNGLGTRGVMLGPTLAKSLFNHLEKGEALDAEIDIDRFV